MKTKSKITKGGFFNGVITNTTSVPSNFKGFYKTNPIKTMKCFEHFIAQHFPQINSKPELIKCALFFLIFNEYELTRKEDIILTGDSANALKAILPCNDNQNLLMKVQVDDNADNLTIDAINGSILESIRTHTSSLPGLMKYIDSSMVMVKFSSITLKNNSSISQTYIQFSEYAANIFTRTDKICKYNKALKEHIAQNPLLLVAQAIGKVDLIPKKCFVAESVDINPTFPTLDDYIQRCNYATLLEFFPKLQTLSQQMITLGKDYGFVHNDLHLGNILLDKKLDPIIIDYGRVYFYDKSNNLTETQSRTSMQTEWYKTNLLELTDTITYSDFSKYFIKATFAKNKALCINPFILESDINHKYFVENMCLFDISTIVMNIIHNLSLRYTIQLVNNTDPDVTSIFADLNSFIKLTGTDAVKSKKSQIPSIYLKSRTPRFSCTWFLLFSLKGLHHGPWNFNYSIQLCKSLQADVSSAVVVPIYFLVTSRTLVDF
jgi:hypothetical protein